MTKENKVVYLDKIKKQVKPKKKLKSEITVKKGSGWFEEAMQSLDNQAKKQ